MRKHGFAADTTGPPDHKGQFSCLLCPLPRDNRIHRDVPRDEVSDRINGEREEPDATSVGAPRHVDA